MDPLYSSQFCEDVSRLTKVNRLSQKGNIRNRLISKPGQRQITVLASRQKQWLRTRHRQTQSERLLKWAHTIGVLTEILTQGQTEKPVFRNTGVNTVSWNAYYVQNSTNLCLGFYFLIHSIIITDWFICVFLRPTAFSSDILLRSVHKTSWSCL